MRRTVQREASRQEYRAEEGGWTGRREHGCCRRTVLDGENQEGAALLLLDGENQDGAALLLLTGEKIEGRGGERKGTIMHVLVLGEGWLT
jgi:hypothetical protein